jgi:hypothetical protein
MKINTDMLLDRYLPKYDFTEVHSIKIKSSPEAAYKAMMELTLGEISGIVGLLFRLRALPEKMVGRKGKTLDFDNGKPLMSRMIGNGFVKIDEQVPREIVFGMIVPGSIGRVWKKTSGLNVTPATAQEFFSFKNPDYLWVVANFMVQDSDTLGVVVLSTESRTTALSSQARKSFTPYWRFIRPWSGLIRRMMLRGARRRAEKMA